MKKQNNLIEAIRPARLRALLPVGAALAALALAACGDTGSTGGEDSSAAAQDDYPLDTCPVSGEELGSMGDPVVVSHEGTTVKLCCDSCIEKFEADPAKYAAMVK